MAYLNDVQIKKLGLKKVGANVKISDKASLYNCEHIEIGDESRIDDFCVVSGRVSIGRFCHITPMCLVAGGRKGIYMSDFCALAYGVKVFSQTDDYSGETLTNSLIPEKYKKEFVSTVELGRHVIVGAEAVILPGVIVAEGCSIGAMSLVNKKTEPWSIYGGVPARRIKARKKDMLKLEEDFLKEYYG